MIKCVNNRHGLSVSTDSPRRGRSPAPAGFSKQRTRDACENDRSVHRSSLSCRSMAGNSGIGKYHGGWEVRSIQQRAVCSSPAQRSTRTSTASTCRAKGHGRASIASGRLVEPSVMDGGQIESLVWVAHRPASSDSDSRHCASNRVRQIEQAQARQWEAPTPAVAPGSAEGC